MAPSNSPTVGQFEAAFTAAVDWSQAQGHLRNLQLIHHTFRLSSYFDNGLGSVVSLLAHPDSLALLRDWHDEPVAADMLAFAQSFYQSNPMRTTYAALSPATKPSSFEKEGKISELFLLAAVHQNFRSIGNRQQMAFLRRLSLWLAIQALSRTSRYNIPLDQNIQAATVLLRRLSRRTESEWALLDKLQQRFEARMALLDDSFQIFSISMARAARELEKDENCDAKARRFLTALQAVAMQAPVAVTDATVASKSYAIDFTADGPSPHSAASLSDIDFIYPATEAFETSEPESADQEKQLLLHLEVNPDHSLGEQALSANSVWMQTTEEHHYFPWGWSGLLPMERPLLQNWIDETLKDPVPRERVGAAMTWIGLHIGRSLPRVGHLEISSEADDEWRLCPGRLCLHRLAPRRRDPFNPDETNREWVAAFDPDLIVVLPETVRAVLKDVGVEGSNGKRLSSIWQPFSDLQLESWFNRSMTGPLSRVLSGMLTHALPQQIFDSSGQPMLARLAASHPRSALPGGLAYTAWDAKAVAAATPWQLASTSDSVTVMGSRLNPIDEGLRATIRGAEARITSLKQTSPIDFHNAYVAHCVMSLQAATGIRAIRDPFESPTHFYWDEGLVYVNDKSDDGLHQGRLCVLPKKLCRRIDRHYRRHLRLLAQALTAERPALASSIEALADGKASNMPFFFFLSPQGDWTSVTPQSLKDLNLFDWPLPANLFRHRFIQQLTASGVDAEIIEGLAGHAESGVASYGDASARCWQDDVDTSRKAIESLYKRLEITELTSWSTAPSFDLSNSGAGREMASDIVFGIKHRDRQRKVRIQQALNSAKEEVTAFLEFATPPVEQLTELSEEQLDQLVTQMVCRKGKNAEAHPHAALRYEYLVTQLEEEKERTQTPLRLRRRFTAGESEQSIVTAESIGALEIDRQLRAAAEVLYKSGDDSPLEQGFISQPMAALLAVVSLIVEHRITYRRLLHDILNNAHYRLIEADGVYYLEYAETLKPDDGYAPVQRHRLRARTAWLLNRVVARKKAIKLDNITLPDSLSDILQVLGNGRDFGDSPIAFIDALADVVERADRLRLPGIVAAALSGRVLSTSLSLANWQRLVSGKSWLPLAYYGEERASEDSDEAIRQQSLQQRDALIEAVQNGVLTCAARNRIYHCPPEEQQRHALQYTKAITDELKTYTKAQRRACAKRLDAISQHWEHKVSGSLLLIGQWVATRVRDGHALLKQPLAPGTVSQYFSTLSRPFRELAYAINLAELDEEDVTELYGAVLTYKQLGGEKLKDFVALLRSFHRWAAKQGVAHPDWGELAIEDESRKVSPGLIREADYQQCLDLIMHSLEYEEDDFKWFLAFTLIVCYRFGLRSREATGLAGQDWWTDEHGHVVLVRNNRERSLKSQASRRAVPQLFELTELEERVIDRVVSRHQVLASQRAFAPLLCDATGKGSADSVSLIAPTLSAILKAVTGDPHTVLHHCRHTFFNRLDAALLPSTSAFHQALIGESFDRTGLQQLVLGPQTTLSRRTSFAIARMVGHATTRTGRLNYAHGVTDWADELLTPAQRPRKGLSHAIRLKTLKRQSKVNTELIAETKPRYQAVSLELILQALKCMSLGKSAETACRMIWLRPSIAPILDKVVKTAGEGMWHSQKSKADKVVMGHQNPVEFLQRVNEDAWARLFTYVKSHPVPHLEEPLSADVLAYRISSRRQLLLATEQDFAQAAALVEYFGLRTGIVVTPSAKANTALRRAGKYRLRVNHPENQSGKERKPSVRLDAFRDYIDDGPTHRRDYCAMTLERNSELILRSSFDLALAAIAFGLRQYFISYEMRTVT